MLSVCIQGTDSLRLILQMLLLSKKPFSQNLLILNENGSIKRAGLFSAVILIVPAMLLALLSAAVLASHGQIHTTGTLARASRNFV